jgi:hypothetical protein
MVEMALLTIQSKQPVCPYLVHLYMCVKMLQPLKTKRIVGAAVLSN